MMSPEPYQAAVAMVDAMCAAGISPSESIQNALLSGELIRFHVDGDRKGRSNGWARLYTDGIPAGAFGSYRMGLRETWRMDCERRPMTDAERRELHGRIEREKMERIKARQAAQDEAATRAECVWERSHEASRDHPYLVRKRLCGEGMRQTGERLVIPMRDADGKLWNVQQIDGEGVKTFLKGGRTKGLMWRVGKPDRVACIGEGVSTMAAVRRATGHAIAAAFSADNLRPVAEAIRDAFPALRLVICADDDPHLVDLPQIGKNVGVEAARAAAEAVGGSVAVPPRRQEA